jgi:hypothetical protein
MSAFPLARSGKNDVGKYHHGNNKVPHRHSPLSNRPRTQKVANHWSRLAPNWFGRRRYEGTHALYFRSIGSTWSAGLNYPEYHATDIAFGEAAAAFTGRPLGIRNAPESSFSARNDAEKSHQTDFPDACVSTEERRKGMIASTHPRPTSPRGHHLLVNLS